EKMQTDDEVTSTNREDHNSCDSASTPIPPQSGYATSASNGAIAEITLDSDDDDVKPVIEDTPQRTVRLPGARNVMFRNSPLDGSNHSSLTPLSTDNSFDTPTTGNDQEKKENQPKKEIICVHCQAMFRSRKLFDLHHASTHPGMAKRLITKKA